MFPSILIIDDEPSIRQSLSGLLEDEGFVVLTASNGYEGLKMIEAEFPDMVLLDIWMPGIDGIETLKEIKKTAPFIQVVMITGHGTIETAVKSTKLGAFDFIEKPLSIDKVIVTINNALNFRRLEEENRYLRKKTIEKHTICGNSSPINELKKQIAIVAPTDQWVLISGENGTGKELVARTIHQFSSRADQPMIAVNCAAIPESMIENELFGHEKGASTDAIPKSRGKFEMANGGTLFFDEIGDMSMKTQAKILRVLGEQNVQRIGGSRVLTVDVRIIAATNKDLVRAIDQGKFREELYFRLNVFPIIVPPLRDRLEDIPVLVETFFDEYARQYRVGKKQMSDEAIVVLQSYSWPGNVRELKNLIGRLVITVEDDLIDLSDLPAPYHTKTNDILSVEAGLFSHDNLDTARHEFEKEFILRKLMQNKRNLQKTAKQIGVDVSYLESTIRDINL